MIPEKIDIAPAEKWADEVIILPSDAKHAAKLRKHYSGPLPEYHGVTDLTKTATETAAIGEAVAGLNEFLWLVCRLPPLAFPAERVHIISREEFDALITPKLDGKCDYGHIYLPRRATLPEFMYVLVHELVHAASYLAITVKETGDDGTDDGNIWCQVDQPRLGLVRTVSDGGSDTLRFHGLNEVATENAAVAIRALIASGSRILDAAGRLSFRIPRSFIALRFFFEHLVRAMAGTGGRPADIWLLVFNDLMKGTDAFLDRLDAWRPDARDTLRDLGTGRYEVVVAAIKLGFYDVTEAILDVR